MSLYSLDEAVADALASPLVFIGKGGWPGLFKVLSCAYRNDRVIVVDTYCTERERKSFEVRIFSPTRGLVSIYAEAKVPISTLARQDYLTFSSTTFPPAALPLPLSLSYEELVGYAEAHGRLRLRICSGGMQGARPLGCEKQLAAYEPDFVARNAPFLKEPPDRWYQLVRHLVAERKRNGAVITSWNRQAWGEAYASANDILLYEYHLKHVGNAEGFFAPVIPTPDSGLLLVGTQSGRGTPVAVRLGPAGQPVWERTLRRPGFKEFEGGSAVQTPDGGFVVFTLAYLDPRFGAAARLTKLGSDGKVRWDWVGQRSGDRSAPHAQTLQLLPQGTFLLKGHVYVGKDPTHVSKGELRGWTGEVDASGRLLRDELGEPDPYKAKKPDGK